MNKLVAHRGIYDNIKVYENSYKAIVDAINKGYDIEIDVRKTKDNILVVYHDKCLKRLHNNDKQIEMITYKELLKIQYKDNTSILTLNKLLEIVNGKVGILVEIKSNNCEKILLDTLKKYHGYYEIQSFNINHLYNIKKINKDIKLGLLINKRLNTLERLKLYILKPSFISLKYLMITPKIIKKYNKYQIYVWTIKKENIDIYQSFNSIIFEEN